MWRVQQQLVESDQDRKSVVYWLPLRVVAVHAAIVGLSAGLSAHVASQLYRHAGLCAPLDRCTLLLLTLPLWMKEKNHNAVVRDAVVVVFHI